MIIQLKSGGSVRCGLPALWAALDRALLMLPTLADAKVKSIDSTIPRVKKGYGLAQAIGSLAAAKRTPRDVVRDIDAVKSQLLAELKYAAEIIDNADRRAALLKSLAALIRKGSEPLYGDLDAQLVADARALHQYKLLGDPSGEAEATAAVLEAEVESMCVQLAKGKDLLRKRRATTLIALYQNAAEAWSICAASAEHPLAVLSDAERRLARTKKAGSVIVADAYKKAYRSTFYDNPNRRVPKLLAGVVARKGNGSYVSLGGSAA